MKKKIYILIILLIFIIAIALLCVFYNNFKLNSNEQYSENEQKYRYKAFQPSFSTSYDGNDSFDLTRDFTYEDGIYCKKIKFDHYFIINNSL